MARTSQSMEPEGGKGSEATGGSYRLWHNDATVLQQPGGLSSATAYCRSGSGFISPAYKSITTGSMRLRPDTRPSLSTNVRVASMWQLPGVLLRFDRETSIVEAHPQPTPRTDGPPGAATRTHPVRATASSRSPSSDACQTPDSSCTYAAAAASASVSFASK